MSGDVSSLSESSPLWDAHEHPDGPLDPDAGTGEAAGRGTDGHHPPIRCPCRVGRRAPTRGEVADMAAGAARLLRHARPLHE